MPGHSTSLTLLGAWLRLLQGPSAYHQCPGVQHLVHKAESESCQTATRSHRQDTPHPEEEPHHRGTLPGQLASQMVNIHSGIQYCQRLG